MKSSPAHPEPRTLNPEFSRPMIELRRLHRFFGATRAVQDVSFDVGRGLSKGMRQRLCLGRAMIHDPSVLILDEPANGLDPRARIELREMIRQLAADGKTVLVSSHILTELAEMCDQVGIIERGKLLAVGSVAEIQRKQTPLRSVRVRVLGGAGPLAVWLGQRP